MCIFLSFYINCFVSFHEICEVYFQAIITRIAYKWGNFRVGIERILKKIKYILKKTILKYIQKYSKMLMQYNSKKILDYFFLSTGLWELSISTSLFLHILFWDKNQSLVWGLYKKTHVDMISFHSRNNSPSVFLTLFKPIYHNAA